jgi:Na+/H+ antiporter NhaC
MMVLHAFPFANFIKAAAAAAAAAAAGPTMVNTLEMAHAHGDERRLRRYRVSRTLLTSG